MADFHQYGMITTLHGLHEALDRQEYLHALEAKLESYSRHLRISLLLPCLFAELSTPDVLDRIVTEIDATRYLHSVVVALGGAPDEERFHTARRYFGRLAKPDREVRLVWVDGPRIQAVLERIRRRDIGVGVQGKGQSVWIALGYILGREEADVVGLHDCDIVTYDRLLLGRLLEPVANPNNDLEFCKGYYARISPRERAMKGRVTRLFVVPFVDALEGIMRRAGLEDNARFFAYHRSFRYPLAGEFSFTTRLARGINIAYDWGLEVSTLSEVYHRVMPRKVAQVDLAANYEHKHQPLSPGDASAGLHRMVVDIARFFLNHLRSHGYHLTDEIVDMLLHTYYQNALLFIKSYSDDAEINGLAYDRYQEEQAVAHFRSFVWEAWEQSKGPHESTLIPSWNRVIYSVPDIYEQLLEAVEADNA